jgi:hypothetical protein
MFPSVSIRQTELGQWIAENMPELDREMGPLVRMEILDRLNAITGLSIPSSAPIRESTQLFLEALKQVHSKEQACSANT